MNCDFSRRDSFWLVLLFIIKWPAEMWQSQQYKRERFVGWISAMSISKRTGKKQNKFEK